jgi:hypothetical protein
MGEEMELISVDGDVRLQNGSREWVEGNLDLLTAEVEVAGAGRSRQRASTETSDCRMEVESGWRGTSIFSRRRWRWPERGDQGSDRHTLSRG